MSDHPPKPKLALSVGVIGHRLNRLPEAARATVNGEIQRVFDLLTQATQAAHVKHADVFAAEQPMLSLVSALAEGADRMAAYLALGAGFALDVPLPFERAVYETDFPDAASRTEFDALLGRARSVLTLPGERGAENRAYETVGLTVIGQSDLLLAVWDGGGSAGPGGTTEMIQTAIRSGLPIVHVDANGQAPTKIIWQGLAPASVAFEAIEQLPANGVEASPDIVEVLVRPPSDADEREKLARYLSEKLDRKRMRIEFPLLLTVAGRRFQPKDSVAPDPQALAAAFAATAAPVAMPPQPSVLAEAYGWADALGVYFAQIFRGAFIWNFLAAAFAVVIAALSLVFDSELKWIFVSVEAILIILVLRNTSTGIKQNWQRRWVEPRELAERLRVALPLWALGTRPIGSTGEEVPWTGWYIRALVRQQGMRAGSLIGDDWDKTKGMLTALLRDQCSYHKDVTEPRMRRLHRRLEHAGEVLFKGTLVVALLYVAFWVVTKVVGNPLSHERDELVKHGVAAVSAAFPALATALYGIRVIGDFEGIAHRSERTHRALQKLIDMIEADPPDLIMLRARARAGAEIMLGDVESWRLAAESRQLSLP